AARTSIGIEGQHSTVGDPVALQSSRLVRRLADTTESIKPGRPVVIWRVDVAFLTADNWKYEGSKAAQGQGGRTHTFGVMNPAKTLAGCAAYTLPGIVLRNGKPVLG